MRKFILLSPTPLTDDITSALSAAGWQPLTARDLESAQRIASGNACLVGLLAFPPDADDRQLQALQQQAQALRQIKWIAAMSEAQSRLPAMRRFIAERLYDFHLFPLQARRLVTVLGHAQGMAQITQDLDADRHANARHMGLIGASPVMQQLFRGLRRAADSSVAVLITGPTGTGKELVARAIHNHSERAQGPFVAINCAAIPPTLLQSELFGHEKGAFTNASVRKTGYIQSAAGGTLFLDEIGDMPLESQATLLRFLEDKMVTPIGSTCGQQVDVRVIASTNVDLDQAIAARSFRPDLYYRLAFLTLETPPLNARGTDIDLLAEAFLEEVGQDAGTRRLRLGDAARRALHQHDWPGNVRELRGTIFQAALSCRGLIIEPSDLKIMASTAAPLDDPFADPPADLSANPVADPLAALRARPLPPTAGGSLKTARDASEKLNLERVLARNDANVTRSARELGVSRMTLYRLMAKHGVDRASAY